MNESKVKGLEWILVKHRGWVLHFKLVYINCFEKKIEIVFILLTIQKSQI